MKRKLSVFILYNRFNVLFFSYQVEFVFQETMDVVIIAVCHFDGEVVFGRTVLIFGKGAFEVLGVIGGSSA